VLELVHSHMCGPTNVVSIRGTHYFIILIDDFSWKSHVYFMRKKSDVLEVFKTFAALVER
jgi:hypothetical protein